ncbi:MAG TPA: M48 family metallopeptidase [Candidatus Dormibacteraeota bacterium]|nr:M48 family metallopeptidase [Candidatus Dormibacteraeota bacterium]
MKTIHFFKSGSVLLVALSLFSGCSTVPVTGRHEMNIIPAGEELQLGLTSFEQLKKETPISHDPAANQLVQRVGKRIAQVAGKDLPNAQWEFVVFESPEANAFCLPGGKVGVYTGILPITKDDAGLATVLGHEIGHAVAHHGGERMTQALALQAGGQVVGAATSSSSYAQAVQLAYGAGSKYAVELPHDRKQESEADHIGLIYMARAGYNPKKAVEFWERFSAYNQQHGSQQGFFSKFLSTHPVDSERIAALQKLMPEAEAEFAKSRLR